MHASVNTPGQVLVVGLIGTTIEYFDFYIYGTAAVLVFPNLFFPSSDRSALQFVLHLANLVFHEAGHVLFSAAPAAIAP